MRSKFNVIRFRLRTLAYRITFSRKPGPLELFGLILAIIGGWTTVQFLGSLAGRSPWIYALAALAALALLTLLARRHIGDYGSLFDRASTHMDLAKRLHDDSIAGMHNQAAWDLLSRIYLPMMAELNSASDSPAGRLSYALDINNRPFLCAILPAPSTASLDELLDPNIVPGNVDPRASSFAEARQSYIRRLRSIDAFRNPMGDEDGDNLILTDLSCSDDILRVSCSVATYGEIVRTSDSLQNEFAIFGFLSAGGCFRRGRAHSTALPHSGARLRDADTGGLAFRARDGLKLLPWRRQIHSWSDSPTRLFFAPHGRAAGLGVSVAMVSNDAGREGAFVALRASNVGVYPGALHVVPSGMCNTRYDLRRGDARLQSDYIKWVMLAELLEECFDLQEMAESRTFDWIAATRRALQARGLESFEPVLTGLALDLLNLRWDVCARVEVGIQKQRDDYRLCWEYSPLQQVRTVALDRLDKELDRRHVVQAGAGSLALAHSGKPSLKRASDDL